MAEIISKKEVGELIKIKGKVMGSVIRSDIEFILRKEGEDSLEMIEKEMEKLGCPLKLNEIKTTEFYPIGLRALFLVATKNVFNFSDERMREMGRELPKFPSVMRFFMKLFALNKKLFFQRVAPFWKKFVTVGEINIPVFDEKNKRVIATLKDFNIHPIFCPYTEGIFTVLVKIATGSDKVTCKETKCPFKGDKFHEFLIEY